MKPLSTSPVVAAAQYVRMSTDEQRNSIPIQMAAIQRFAIAHGYEVVATYTDAGKSGVGIKHRPGLQQLIKDVVSGQTGFRVILVYDVSRWGRFQDNDEAAHYEFLCRDAGIPIHYCAEQFENDGRMPNQIMKSLKRMMAGEYSRELSIKVSAGQRKIVAEGFHGGGLPGYGLRRMLVSPDGHHKQLLQPREHKYIKSDHTILVPGTRHEVECIRTMFSLAANKKSPAEIAEELNRRNLRSMRGGCWSKGGVYRLLKNEKYMGCNVWGKTEQRFRKSTRRLPPSTWTTKDNALVPIVSPREFARVQKLIHLRKTKLEKKTDAYFLNAMKRVLAKEGKLNQKILNRHGIFGSRAYCALFGSMMRAYELIGYQPPAHTFKTVGGWKKMRGLKENLLIRLKELFHSQLKVIRLPGQSDRVSIELDNGRQVALHVCPPHASAGGKPRWLLTGHIRELGLPALICLPNKLMTKLTNFYVVPEFGGLIRNKQVKILREGHPWLVAGRRLKSLSEFYEAANRITETWHPDNDITIVGDVVITERSSTITIADQEILLAPSDASIFKMLVHNTGHIVPSDELRICGNRRTEWFLPPHIHTLRKKLAPFRRRIVTVRGEGYMYVPGS